MKPLIHLHSFIHKILIKNLLLTFFILCLSPTPLLAAQYELRVVASFGIITDWVTQVGAPYVAVKSIIPPNHDAHNYQLTTQDARDVANADLLFINGLGFDDSMKRLVDAKKLVITSTGIQTIKKSKENHDHGHAHDAKEKMDPHAWQDLSNINIYVNNIVTALSAQLPERKTYFAEQAKTYLAEVAELNAHIKTQISTIPEKKRSVVTEHDAFGYFTNAYGLTFLGLQGLNHDGQTSAARMSRLIKQIRQQKVSAIFAEAGIHSNKKLLQTLSQETGVMIAGELYADTLTTPPHPASSYLGMMRSNLAQIEKAFGLTPLQPTGK